jgi:hypothetical protein
MGCGCEKVIHGAVGLTKAALGVDAIPLEVMQARRDECRDCEHATRNPSPRYAVNKGLTSLSRCRKCDCLIAAKTKLAGERCPIGRWGTFPPTA